MEIFLKRRMSMNIWEREYSLNFNELMEQKAKEGLVSNVYFKNEKKIEKVPLFVSDDGIVHITRHEKDGYSVREEFKPCDYGEKFIVIKWDVLPLSDVIFYFKGREVYMLFLAVNNAHKARIEDLKGGTLYVKYLDESSKKNSLGAFSLQSYGPDQKYVFIEKNVARSRLIYDIF